MPPQPKLAKLIDNSDASGDANETISLNSSVVDGEFEGYSIQQLNDGGYSLMPPQSTEEIPGGGQAPIQYRYVTTAQSTLDDTQSMEYQYVPAENESTVTITTSQYDALKDEIRSMRSEVAEIKNKMDAQAEILGRIFTNTSNVDKFIGQFLKGEIKPIEDGNVPLEQFEDLEKMPRLKTTEEMEEFELQLQDPSYVDRFIRFLKTRFNFDSAQKGETTFGLIMRQVLDVQLLIPYSWKGKSRKSAQNICFAVKHAGFVSFIARVVRMADRSKTVADVEAMFEKLLRFKKQNIEREKSRGERSQNLPAPRTRLPQDPNINSHIGDQPVIHGVGDDNQIDQEEDQFDRENQNDKGEPDPLQEI